MSACGRAGKGFAQSKLQGIVYYESRYSEKKINDYFSKKRDSIKTNKQIKLMDNLLLKSKKTKSTLKFSTNQAIYSVDKKLDIDNHGGLAEKFSLLSAGGSNMYYTNSQTETLDIQNCETLDECFIIKSNFKKWQLTQETKKISGYVCYKALRTVKSKKRNFVIEAWYTPSIPANFGPKGECGLPGLILEVENGTINFKATKIILNPKEKVKVLKPTKGNIVSEEEFQVLIKKASDNIFDKRN